MNDHGEEGSGASALASSVARPAAEEVHADTDGPYARGRCVVCIALQSPPDIFALCLASVVAHTAIDVPIVVAELASADPATAGILRDIGGEHEIIHRPPLEAQRSANLSRAIASVAPADVILLRGDCRVGPGWHAGLRRAAYAESHAASASALSNDAGFLSVPERNVANALRADLTIDEASAAVAAHALRRYPSVPTAVARATYLRRDALDLVGGLDESFAAVDAAVVDFSQRCVTCGLVHLVADDVFVFQHSPGPLTADGLLRGREATEDATIATRYPFFSARLDESEQASDRPLPAALARARRALNGMSVTIDGRRLVSPSTGTHVIVLETVRALAALESVDLRVIVPPDLAGFARIALAELDVKLIQADGGLADLRPSDVVHRPFQVFGAADLELLRSVGGRLVITHLDTIAYDNASYFPSFSHWQQHRLVTRLALALADCVVFLSRDAATDAANEQLVEPSQSVVVHPGLTYSYAAGAERRRPAGLDRLAGRPFMVSIGADFHHKNRVFALELVAAMRREHGWPGAIVFAGPRVSHGSSAGEETRFIAHHPDIADACLALPWVSEAEKAWLIENSVAVCHPSTREGLGLMPFEAAAQERPCIYASTTALAELQPAGLATITPWDARESAARVMALLADPQRTAEHIRLTNERAREFTWQTAAKQLLDVYEAAMAANPREARRVANDLLDAELATLEIHRKYDELWGGLRNQGKTLLAPDGVLDGADQDALLALARRPFFRRAILKPVRFMRRRRGALADEPPATAPADFALHFDYSNRRYMAEHLTPAPDLDQAS